MNKEKPMHKDTVVYALVPVQDFQKLEDARLALLKMIESVELLNMAPFEQVTQPIYEFMLQEYEILCKEPTK